MTAHVFYFKWPRIQEDLVHEEIENWVSVQFIQCPIGAFIYNGFWFQRTRYRDGGCKQVAEHQVPKQIRLHMLLLM